VVLTDSTRQRVIRAERVDSVDFRDPAALEELLADMAARNEPIALDLPTQGRQYLYYADSVVLTQLRYYPVVQLVLIGVFLVVAYLIFSSYRRAEQNQVWVGMAKETAHQLGTPMSSLMAWIGLLEAEGVSPDYLREMNRDVERLNMVADRFSKIGSKPMLEPLALEEVVRATVDYMRPRIGSQVAITFEAAAGGPQVPLSPSLFSWVLENLMRNAVDAMEGEGTLDLHLSHEGGEAVLDVRDSGKGIPRGQWREVFKPGFTTKSRGWGLGLSLTKRIIESYHQGKISVHDSRVGEFTTFRITLPHTTS
jgi:signal transduction histidine kinase